MNKERIRATIETLYEDVINGGKAELLPSLIAGPYIQHDPNLPNGIEPLMGFLEQAGSIPCEIKRMAIDGDLAFVHVRFLDLGGMEQAGVEIFRFDSEARILEHWGVMQPVPEQAANTNTMF